MEQQTVLKIKPCPFCGGTKIDVTEVSTYGGDCYKAMCECGAEGPPTGDIGTERDAYLTWNERKPEE